MPPAANGVFSFGATPDSSEASVLLRQEAESRLEDQTPDPEFVPLPTPALIDRALQELRIHQVELEMQNEELRRAQLELDIARARYFDLYDLAPVGYCTLSIAGVIVQTNLAAAHLLGLTRAGAIGRAFARFIDPQDQVAVHSLLLRASAEQRHSAEVRMFRGDGSLFWAQLVVTLAQDEKGSLERRMVLSDISERKQAEMGRRESEARFRELFSRAVDGIAVCAADGALENVNKSFCQLHGWGPDEGPGLNLRDLDTTGVAMASPRMGLMLAGEVSTFEVEHRHRQGGSIWLSGSTSLIFVSGTPRLLGYYRPSRPPPH